MISKEAKSRAQNNYRIKNREKIREKSRLYNKKRRLDPRVREIENSSRIRLPELPFYLDITEEEAMRIENIWNSNCPLHYESCRIEVSDGTEQTEYIEEGRQLSSRSRRSS